ncbi:MAG: hypothetical protein M3N16_02215 [Actinomycetota bacterium]|nr:hypothetical protein [Actinomycetota bacterium]
MIWLILLLLLVAVFGLAEVLELALWLLLLIAALVLAGVLAAAYVFKRIAD